MLLQENHLIYFWCSESKMVFEREKALKTVLTNTVKNEDIIHLRHVICGSEVKGDSEEKQNLGLITIG